MNKEQFNKLHLILKTSSVEDLVFIKNNIQKEIKTRG
jgi:hypothetical protein